MIILYEPTVGLDPATERDLLRTVFQTLQGKTLIWITHHLVGVEQMDEVVFIEEGQLKCVVPMNICWRPSLCYRHLYQLDRPILADVSTV